jgi:hypothetical protein
MPWGGATASGDTGTLGVIIAPDEPVAGAVSWVIVRKNGAVVKTATTAFRVPIVFKDVPTGAVEIEVVGKPCGSTKGVFGRAKIVVGPEHMATARVRGEVKRSTPITFAICGAEGVPLGEHCVEIWDKATQGEAPLRAGGRTTKDGTLIVQGYSGRTYQLSLGQAKPAKHVYWSKAVTVGDDEVEMAWTLRCPPLLTMRFVTEEDGKRRTMTEVRSVSVATVDDSMGWEVRDGECVVVKSVPPLRGAKAIRVCPEVDPSRGIYAVVENERVVLNDDPNQVCVVVLKPKIRGTVMVQCAVANAVPGVRRVRARAVITKKAGGSVVGRAGVNRYFHLDEGEYRIVVVAKGMKIVTKDVTVSGASPVTVKCQLHKADMLRCRVVDHGGKPVKGAFVGVRYPEHPYIGPEYAATVEDGTTSLPTDCDVARMLNVWTENKGCALASLPKGTRTNIVEMRIGKLCSVGGKIIVAADVDYVQPKDKLFVYWAYKDHPTVLAHRSPITAGEYSAFLPESTYKPYFMVKGAGVALPDVTVKRGETDTTLPGIIINRRLWSKMTHLLKVH